MNAVFNWSILSIKVYKLYGYLPDIIYYARVKCQAETIDNGNVVAVEQIMDSNWNPNTFGKSYTPFDQFTEALALQICWITDINKSEVEQQLLAQLEQKVNTMEIINPWS